MSSIEIEVPDLGDFADVPVIEVLVKPGDRVAPEDPLVTLESDKATMEVPAQVGGVVTDVAIKVGDKVSTGTRIATIDTVIDDTAARRAHNLPGAAPPGARVSPPSALLGVAPGTSPEAAQMAPRGEKGLADSPGEGANPTPPTGPTIEVQVPDLGDFHDVPIIELHVRGGDIVKRDDPLVTLESDKATMEVPSPLDGVVEALRVQVGTKVSAGTVLLTLRSANDGAPAALPQHAQTERHEAPVHEAPSRAEEPSRATAPAMQPAAAAAPIDEQGFRVAHASPSVRKFARELGVDLGRLTGSGPKQRILHEDVQAFVKRAMTGEAGTAPATPTSGGFALQLPPWPQIDFAKFGPVEERELPRIKKISGANLARNWVAIPHVTQFDEADITDLEALRVQLNKENEKSGVKITMLAFLVKASVAALQAFPDFNASLKPTPEGDKLVFKRYYNIGFAADTPNGLVVPVIRNADSKGVAQIAGEMAALSKKAREGKIAPTEMQGGCFSISSLGGIGGTAFTPIINAPEVAILGVSRHAMKPVWDGAGFVPRMILPLSLSYDHRVIDGAAAARFTSYLAHLLADMRRALL